MSKYNANVNCFDHSVGWVYCPVYDTLESYPVYVSFTRVIRGNWTAPSNSQNEMQNIWRQWELYYNGQVKSFLATHKTYSSEISPFLDIRWGENIINRTHLNPRADGRYYHKANWWFYSIWISQMETLSLVINATPSHEWVLENVWIFLNYYLIDWLKGLYSIP